MNDDLISRQDAIDAVYTLYDDDCFHESERDIGWNNAIDNSVRKLKSLPSAQSEKSTTEEKSQLAEEKSTRKLIYLDEALNAFGLSEKTRKYGGDHSGYDTMMLYEIQGTLESLPSAQPEIIRCKDCEQWQTDWESSMGDGHFCPDIDLVTDGNFFCGFADKRI